MNNLREVNDDIMKDWLMFREEDLGSLTCEEDKKHWIYFDEISEKILRGDFLNGQTITVDFVNDNLTFEAK